MKLEGEAGHEGRAGREGRADSQGGQGRVTCIMETAEEFLKLRAVFSWIPSEIQSVIRTTATIAHALCSCCYHGPDVNVKPLHHRGSLVVSTCRQSEPVLGIKPHQDRDKSDQT